MSLIRAILLIAVGATGWIPSLFCGVLAVFFHSQQVSVNISL